MRKFLFFALSLHLLSCENRPQENTHEQLVNETPVVEEIDYPTLPKVKRQFYIAKFVVEEAVSSLTSGRGTTYTYQTNTYVTDVNSIDEPFTEDLKYQYLDMLENSVRGKSRVSQNGFTIKSRELLIYDSYKEASIERNKFLDDSETKIE